MQKIQNICKAGQCYQGNEANATEIGLVSPVLDLPENLRRSLRFGKVSNKPCITELSVRFGSRNKIGWELFMHIWLKKAPIRNDIPTRMSHQQNDHYPSEDQSNGRYFNICNPRRIWDPLSQCCITDVDICGRCLCSCIELLEENERTPQNGTFWEITTHFQILAINVVLLCVSNEYIANNWKFVAPEAMKCHLFCDKRKISLLQNVLVLYCCIEIQLYFYCYIAIVGD